MRSAVLFRVFAAAGALCVAGAAPAQQPLGQVVSADSTVKGSVVLVNGAPHLASGSTVKAGAAAALVKLDRGGQVRICPGSAAILSSSDSGHRLMISLSDGAVETHYSIPAVADTIVTPDFRIMLAGPGQFDLAVRTNRKGDTCIQSRSDSASVVVNELLGDGIYQVRARDSIVFHDGHVAGAETETDDCGCPHAPRPVQRAQVAPAPSVSFGAPPPKLTPVPGDDDSLVAPPPAPEEEDADVGNRARALAREVSPVGSPGRPVQEPFANLPQLAINAAAIAPPPPQASFQAPMSELPQFPADPDLTAPLPPVDPHQVQVQVDAPMVFQALAPPPEATLARLSISDFPVPELPLPAVASPPTPPPPTPTPTLSKSVTNIPESNMPLKKRGFFGRVFGALFGKS